MESIIQQAKECALVVLATAGEKLDVTDGTTGQEVTVDRVLQGTGITAEENCMIWRITVWRKWRGHYPAEYHQSDGAGKQYLICLEEIL